ncbi:MAG: GAF domain-containing protein, partial [Xanthomonadales bacterium]|nr:GAF domain-containing protein [Xanthomonadales bacterium]
DLAQLVNSTLDLSRVMDAISERFNKILSFDLMTILFLDQEEQCLKLGSAMGPVSDKLVDQLQNLKIPMSETKSAFVISARSRKPRYLPNVAMDAGAQEGVSAQAYKLIPAKSLIAFPLVIEDEVIGVMTLTDTRQHFDLEPDEIQHLERFVPYVATAIRNARMFESVKSSKEAAEIARQSAEQANQAKSQFLANMSHE